MIYTYAHAHTEGGKKGKSSHGLRSILSNALTLRGGKEDIADGLISA